MFQAIKLHSCKCHQINASVNSSFEVDGCDLKDLSIYPSNTYDDDGLFITIRNSNISNLFIDRSLPANYTIEGDVQIDLVGYLEDGCEKFVNCKNLYRKTLEEMVQSIHDKTHI